MMSTYDSFDPSSAPVDHIGRPIVAKIPENLEPIRNYYTTYVPNSNNFILENGNIICRTKGDCDHNSFVYIAKN